MQAIIKYIGDVRENGISDGLEEIRLLLGDYAIVSGTQSQIENLRNNQNVIYIEVSEEFYFDDRSGIRNARELTMMQVSAQQGICKDTPSNETGEGVIMAYLDSGIDYRHPEFIDGNGETRIYGILDLRGREVFYTEEKINEALLGENQEALPMDYSGHGTHVAAIGSGNTGVAPGSRILMVALQEEKNRGISTADFMKGIDFCIRTARERKQPIVLNISIGNNAGSHNGTTLVEHYLDDVLDYAKACIVVGMGNEGIGTSHYQGRVMQGRETEASFSVGEFQGEISLQLWKEITQEVKVTLISPLGQGISFGNLYERTEYQFANERIQILVEQPTPVQINEKIQINLVPRRNFLTQGIWRLALTTDSFQSFMVDIWLPVSETLSELTGFLEPNSNITLTIPASAKRVISVGAYNQMNNQVADFSGRGYTWNTNLPKPDLIAPGVGIVSAARGGGYTMKSGTSMATPFVSGAAALLMEWGIVKLNDPFLYGDRLKAFLRKGAKPISQFDFFPNNVSGYGELCVKSSFPESAFF